MSDDNNGQVRDRDIPILTLIMIVILAALMAAWLFNPLGEAQLPQKIPETIFSLGGGLATPVR